MIFCYGPDDDKLLNINSREQVFIYVNDPDNDKL